MKKKFKTLTAFLLLLTLIIIKPIQPPVDNDNEPGISVCGDDDENDYEIIASE